MVDRSAETAPMIRVGPRRSKSVAPPGDDLVDVDERRLLGCGGGPRPIGIAVEVLPARQRARCGRDARGSQSAIRQIGLDVVDRSDLGSMSPARRTGAREARAVVIAPTMPGRDRASADAGNPAVGGLGPRGSPRRGVPALRTADMADRFAIIEIFTVRGPRGDSCDYCEWVLSGRTSGACPRSAIRTGSLRTAESATGSGSWPGSRLRSLPTARASCSGHSSAGRRPVRRRPRHGPRPVPPRG
jgi:hypothetical protein